MAFTAVTMTFITGHPMKIQICQELTLPLLIFENSGFHYYASLPIFLTDTHA